MTRLGASARIPDTGSRFRLKVMLAIQTYLLITLLGWLVGPLDHPRPEVWTATIFVLAYQLTLFLGFLGAERRTSTNQSPRGEDTGPHEAGRAGSGMKLLITVASLASIGFAISSIAIAAGTVSPTGMWAALIESLADPGAAYGANRSREGTGGLVTMMSTGFAPFYVVGFPLGLYYFRSLGPSLKFVVIGDGFLQAATSGIRGTNFGVFKIIVVVATILVLRGGLLRLAQTLRARRAARLGMLAGPIFILYFVFATGSRFSNRVPTSLSGMSVDYNNPFIVWTPDALHLPVILVFSYLCQGYYGFAHALEQPFTTTYGLGSSKFLSDNALRFMGTDVTQRSYLVKMDDRWDPEVNWHTAYTWFANDVSVWGLFVIMILLGVLFSSVLRAAMRGETVALALAPLYVLMLLFLPLNNAVLSNPLTGMPFIVLTFVFVVRRARVTAAPVNTAVRPDPTHRARLPRERIPR